MNNRYGLHRMHTLKRLLLSCTLLLGANIALAEESPLVAVLAKQIVDGTSKQALVGQAVLVRDKHITAVVDAQEIPAEARIIDLGDATLLPGLIDSHAHPLMAGDDYQQSHLQNSSAYKAVKGYRGMEGLLLAGWTSLRVAGDADVYYGNQDIRRLIDEGVINGPRIFGAAHYLSITGGGGDVNFYSPEQTLIADGLVVDGPEEARKAVRTEAKYGADWVKVLVTGAFMSVGDNPRAVQFSEEEMRAIVDEANRQGMPVMAHAHAAEGIKMAVRLGARSIEHGTYLDDVTIRMMKKRGTYLVPTLYIGDYYNDSRNNLRQQAEFDDYTENYRHIFLEKIGKAHRAGVKVVAGVDLGGYGYDPTVYVRELAVLMEAGLTPMEAIQAATSVPAEMLGKPIGSIAPGKLADLIAVAGNPLQDISELERVRFVMSDGEIVKNEF